MREEGRIVEFTSEGKAVVEFESRGKPCAACAAFSLCAAEGETARRMVLDVIPGVAQGALVYVDVGPRSLLKMPALAYVVLGSFLAGLAGSAGAMRLFEVRAAQAVNVIAGLAVAAAVVAALAIHEQRRRKDASGPHIVGVAWRTQGVPSWPTRTTKSSKPST